MDQLIEKLNKLLATSFAFYLKTHFFHWNVKGQDFFQYHNFFGELYNDVWASIDKTAEEIRALDGVAQGSFSQYANLSTVHDQTSVPSIQEMVGILRQDNDAVVDCLLDVHEMATQQNTYGLINYIEDRIDVHKKHRWMLKSAEMTASVAAESVDVLEMDAVVEEAAEQPITEEIRSYYITPGEQE